MRLLLLDTCGAQGSIALADTAEAEVARIVASALIPGRSASERLVATIRDLLTQHAWAPISLDAIGVVTGPGSFTGVRVGLAAAKGLAEALSIPIHPISRLTTLAASAEVKDAEICALLDAGRNEFYCGRYRNDECLAESLISFEEASATIQAAAVAVVCEAKVFEAFSTSSHSARLKLVDEPTAADALPFALRLVQQGETNSLELDANYLRKTDAEIFAKPTASSAR